MRELAQLCLRIEAHFNSTPQDIEWSYGAGQFYLLQSRPITTLGEKVK
ncbi:MAG TPA: PEP/pyruvate-binding domain-containing protein [Desulfosporosinus sp.]